MKDTGIEADRATRRGRDCSGGHLSRHVLDAIELGVLTVDEAGLIDYVNPAGERLFGQACMDMLGRSPLCFAAHEDRAEMATLLDRVGGGARERCEARVLQKNGSVRWLEFTATPMPGQNRGFRGAAVVFSDVTEAKTVAAAAQRSEAELRDLYDRAPCGYHSLDASGTVVRMNETELSWLGYSRDEVIGRMSMSDLLRPDFHPRFWQHLELLKQGKGVRDCEYEMRRKDGTVFPVLLTAITLKGPDGKFLRTQASVVDLTERKRAEAEEKWHEQKLERYAQELRAASRRLVEVQEAERRALASALHDLVGQNLTALSINLTIVKSEVADRSEPRTAARLEDSLALVEETIESIRDVMTELRPALLDDYGLAAVLRWYAEQFARRTGVATTVIENGDCRRLPPATEEALFRIAQEALANVAKYAHAGKARVTVSNGDDGFELTIADEGCGFDVTCQESPSAHHGWGLTIMRERAAAAGARLVVESAVGCGTSVRVSL